MVAHLLYHILNHDGVFRCGCYKEASLDFWGHLKEEAPVRTLEVEEEQKDNKFEILANVFALRLLIPKTMLLDAESLYYPAVLAKAFQVSEELMRIRMAEDCFDFNPTVFTLEHGYFPPPLPPKPPKKSFWETLQKWRKGV